MPVCVCQYSITDNPLQSLPECRAPDTNATSPTNANATAADQTTSDAEDLGLVQRLIARLEELNVTRNARGGAAAANATATAGGGGGLFGADGATADAAANGTVAAGAAAGGLLPLTRRGAGGGAGGGGSVWRLGNLTLTGSQDDGLVADFLSGLSDVVGVVNYRE